MCGVGAADYTGGRHPWGVGSKYIHFSYTGMPVGVRDGGEGRGQHSHFFDSVLSPPSGEVGRGAACGAVETDYGRFQIENGKPGNSEAHREHRPALRKSAPPSRASTRAAVRNRCDRGCRPGVAPPAVRSFVRSFD